METISNETLTTWLTQLGPLLPAAEIRQVTPHHWTIIRDEFIAIDIEHLPGESKLVLSAELGRALTGEEAATYQLLLQVNALWRETGGMRMALDACDGELTQLYDLALCGLDRDGLENRLRNFEDAARGWREVIATKAVVGDDDAPPPHHFTRV